MSGRLFALALRSTIYKGMLYAMGFYEAYAA